MRKYGFVKPLILIPLDSFFLWSRNLTTWFSSLIWPAFHFMQSVMCLYFEHQTEITKWSDHFLKSLFKKVRFIRIFHTSFGLALGPVLVNITRCWWWNLHQYTTVSMVMSAPVTSYSHSLHWKTLISNTTSFDQLPSGYYADITWNLILLCKLFVHCWRSRAVN